MKTIYFSAFAVLLAGGLSVVSTTALAQHGDVFLTDVNGQVAIGAASEIGSPEEAFDLDTRVFETILVPGFAPPTPADYESEEPGFFALNGSGDASELAALGATALPAGVGVSASLNSFSMNGATSTLFYWDGFGSVNFTPAPTGTSFAFNPSVNFASTGPNGDLDGHPIYQLNATSGVPADGVYLISPAIEVAGLATSENFYSVLLADALITGEDGEHAVEEALELFEEGTNTNAVADFGGGVTKDFAFYEAAVEFVEDATAVPEPTAALLGFTAFGLVSLYRFRSRA